MKHALPGSFCRWAGFCLMLAVLAGCQTNASPKAAAAAASPPLPTLSFDDTVTLDNGVVRLGVSPGVGRVVDFGLSGGENLIWINTQAAYTDATPGVAVENQRYANLGGDKLWPTAQPLWKLATGNDNWPPDGVLDGGAWQLLDQTDHSVTLQSQLSPHYGVVVLRSFTLTPGQAQVKIQNVIQRVHANPIPVSAWTITQVKKPNAVVFDIADDAPDLGEPVRPLTDDTAAKVQGYVHMLGSNQMAAWKQQGEAWAKLGTFGRWVAAVYDDVTFLQETDFDPHGAYPELSSAQAYHAADYTELELLSPMLQLAPGQTLQNTVVWTLIKISAEHAYPTLLSRKRN